jgi:ABC-2 type transport system permease protein
VTDLIGFFALLRREVYRWVVLPNQTIVPPLINAALYVVIFGYAIGSRVREVEGVSYIVFIFPGLVMMNAVNGAYANTTTSLFISRHELFIQDLLVSPLSYLEMALAYTLGGAIRGVVVGLSTLVVGYAFLGVHIHHAGATVFFMAISSLACAAFGTIIGLWAERWDHVAIYLNYVITPMVFLGGVFYSLKMLPEAWQKVNLANPIFYAVCGFRYGIIGISDVSPLVCGVIGTVLFAALFAGCVALFKSGYKLRA